MRELEVTLLDPVVPPGGSTACVTATGSGTNSGRQSRRRDPTANASSREATTQRVSSVVLASKAINLPQPPYPTLARQIKVTGAVSVQILIDESGESCRARSLWPSVF